MERPEAGVSLCNAHGRPDRAGPSGAWACSLTRSRSSVEVLPGTWRELLSDGKRSEQPA